MRGVLVRPCIVALLPVETAVTLTYIWGVSEARVPQVLPYPEGDNLDSSLGVGERCRCRHLLARASGAKWHSKVYLLLLTVGWVVSFIRDINIPLSSVM